MPARTKEARIARTLTLDKRIEEGLAGAESILQPWRTRVIDTVFPDDQHIDIDLTPVGRVKVNIVHLVDGEVTQSTEYKTLAHSEVHEMLQRERLTTPLGPAVLEGPESPWAYLVSDLERALVAFDRLEEMGTPLDGLGAAGRPANRIFVTDTDDVKWQARIDRPTGHGGRFVYTRMVGRNYENPTRTFWADAFEMRPMVRAASQVPLRTGATGFIVAPRQWEHRTLQHEVDEEFIPLLSEAEATRLLAFTNAYFDYFATGQNQLDYRAGKANKLGRAAQVATLKVWRNPVEGVASTRDDGDERLAVYVYPESGTDTVGLESQKDRVSQISLRPTLFTHASVLGARYAQPSYNTIPERVRGGPGSEDLILVYPFGMETYGAGAGGMKRVGLYARVSDVYNALYAGWREHQKGWGQRDGGLRTMPNFPFEVELRWGKGDGVPAAGRIEYMGKNKAGIPQFEVTADATRGATSSMWSKRVRGKVIPRTFYTDAKLLQRTPNLYESKELLKWQHSHNPDGNPALLGPTNGTRLSPDSHQQVMVALDARYEAGLKGVGDSPHLFPLFERDDTGYPAHTSDAFAKVGMGRDGYPYVWVFRVRDYVFDGKRMVPRELPKPILTITQSIFAFTNSRELYYGFKANRADGDREEVNWHINRPDIDAIRAEVCRKMKSGEVKLDDWTRGTGPWCDPVAKPEGLSDAAVEVTSDDGMCEGE